jgi:hypothetical protein
MDVMEVVGEFLDGNALDQRLIEEAENALPPLPKPERAKLVITGDMVRSVNRRGRHGTEHVPYAQERVTGLVGGKTLHRGEDSDIVVVAGPFLRGAENAFRGLDMPRVIRHEGWHVVIYQRDEDIEPLWKFLPEELSDSDRHLVGISVASLTEFRIEKTLWNDGWPVGSRAGDTQEILEEARVGFGRAVQKRTANESILRTFEQSYSVFNQIATHFCYVAAEDDSARAPGLGTVDGKLWERYVDGYWDQLLRTSEGIPEASIPEDPQTLVGRFLPTIPFFCEWFAHMGFLLEERDGGMYLDILRTDF